MALTVKGIDGAFAGIINGIDIARPLSDADFARVREAFHQHAVLVFPGQDIDDAAQIRFSRRFGPLETSIRYGRPGGAGRPEISNLTNVDDDGELYDLDDWRARYHVGNQMWHSDSSFKPVPADASVLSARAVPPEGGETEFADMRAAFETLPQAKQRRLDGLVAEHSLVYSRRLISGDIFDADEKAELPPVQQVVVRSHPETGRKALFIGAHASHIVGWPIDEGRALLAELLEGATQPRFVYRHVWQAKDLILWDNRCVLHRGRPWPADTYPRVMRRTTVAGPGPTV